MLHPLFLKGFKRTLEHKQLRELGRGASEIFKLFNLSHHRTKITVNGDCSHEIKRFWLLGRKATTNLDSILIKQRHHFANNGLCNQSCGFSSGHVQVWELGHKEAEGQRVDAFKLWCWRRLLRVPWTSRKSNQSILKEINPEYSLEELMLKLKLHYFGHLMWRVNSLEKTVLLGNIEGKRRREWQRMRVGWHHWLNRHEFEQTLGVGDGQGSLVCCSLWGRKEPDMT